MRNKIYFASDFHLGVPSYEKSLERERRVISWLNSVEPDAQTIYLIGDLFDFWYEYKHVIPKGYIRFLGKLAELKDKGIEVICFTGNHDMWMFDYLTKELNIPVYRKPIEVTLNGKSFLIGHGDGLGPGDHGYKLIKKIFSNPVCIWLFKWLHPDIGMSIANYWSRKSRIATGNTDDIYQGDDKEWLVQYCKEQLKIKHTDFFIFGHRHLPIEKQIEKSLYINLGDWIKYDTYAVFDGEQLKLRSYKPEV
jgi:UDP-2,3-diacylglucosamine hydrolase